MNFENEIKDIIQQRLNDGIVEKAVSEQLEKGIEAAISEMFSRYGDVTKLIRQRITSVIVPYLESYDYSSYIVKLDKVLVDILEQTTVDNKKMLENFKDLMLPIEEKEIEITDLFDRWKKMASEHVNTYDLEVNIDDEPSYEPVEVTMEVKELKKDWSSFHTAIVDFKCEHDSDLNVHFTLSKFGERESWGVSADQKPSLSTLRGLSEIDVLLLRLSQGSARVIVDSHYEEDDIYPDATPEATY